MASLYAAGESLRHANRITRACNRGIEQNGVVAKFHHRHRMGRPADTGIDDQRYIRKSRPHRFQRRQIERSHGAADRRAPGHQHLTAGIQQLLSHDKIVRCIGKYLETIVTENFRRFDQRKNIGLQRVVMADDLQLDPVGLKNLTGHLRRQHRFLDRVATGRVGQDAAIQLTDQLKNWPPFLPPAVSRRSEIVRISVLLARTASASTAGEG